MNHLRFLIFAFSSLLITGCATVNNSTLPANNKPLYDFSAYSIVPLNKQEWRFLTKNDDMEYIAFTNSAHNSMIFIDIIPAFKDSSISKEGIIKHSEDRILKELRLSPDIDLGEQNLIKKDMIIGDKAYKALSIMFNVKGVKNIDLELSIYYWLSPENNILYICSLLIDIHNVNTDEIKTTIRDDFYSTIKQINYKNPTEEQIRSFRAIYACNSFLTAAPDKYLKEKTAQIKEKYDIAISETTKWSEEKPNNYMAYNLLGCLYTYNDKFEQYGSGFNYDAALNNFKKAIGIRKNYKQAHFHLASLFEAVGKTDEAILEYNIVADISPNDENTYYKLGKLYEAKSDRGDAKKFYEMAIRYWRGTPATLEEVKNKIKNL